MDDPLSKDYYKHPLTHYYISSSHKTYLIGNQITDPVHITGYINAIKMGCRSFEIECHDSKDQNDIKIYNGYDITSFLDFKGIQSIIINYILDVIKLIRDYSFIDNPLPVVLCLNILCKPTNHYMIAEVLKEVLGTRLHIVN